MRAFVQRLLPFALAGLAAVLSGRAAAQSNSTPGGPADNTLEAAAAEALLPSVTEPEVQPDEVTVRGRKSDELGRYRLEMTKAKNKFVEVFNDVNSTDDNDVTCRNERPTGTRLSHNVCRSKAEGAADAAAAKGFLDALLRSSGGYITNTRGGPPPAGGAQVNALVGTAKSQQGGVTDGEEARAKLEAELKKLIAENRELFRAVVKYVEARDEYNKARGRGDVIYGASNPAPQ